MTPILAPTTLASAAGAADRIIETLATYTDEHSCDSGGGHQRTMLLASLIVLLFDTPAPDAIELAKHGAWDERVRTAGQARDEILARVQRARYATEQAWTPTKGDIVTWDGHDGVWIVRGYEDDATVWIHRPDVRMVPSIGRNGGGMVDLSGWHDEPAHEDLVAVADLRPVNTATEVTV